MENTSINLVKYAPYMEKFGKFYYFRIGKGLFGGKLWANYESTDGKVLYPQEFFPTLEGALAHLDENIKNGLEIEPLPDVVPEPKKKSFFRKIFG